jgi:hypothetical protein
VTRGGWRDVVTPLALWIAASVAAAAVGFRMEIPWADWHLLDRSALAAHPLASLCWLHSQPPVLNVLLSVVLRTADGLGVAPEAVALALYGALGAIAAVLLHRVIRDLTGSARLAALGVALVLVDPAYHVFANLFFYEFLVYVLLIVVVAASARYLRDGRPAALVALTLALAATSLTRTLFHPIWAVGVQVVVVALRAHVAPSDGRRIGRLAPAFGLLLALLLAWPVKNALVFGRFQSASLSAYSLARISRTCGQPAGYMTADQLLSEEERITARAARWCGPDAAFALTQRDKSDGSVNWNHATFLARAPAWEACALDFVRTHPRAVLRKAVANYASWTQPSFLQPQLGYGMGPPSFPYLAYAYVLVRTVFYDLRPAAERLWPDWFLHREAHMPNGRPIGYSLFGALLYPAALIALAVAGARRARTPDGALVLVLLAITVPPMVAACLTDGEEGNRMRFATTPMLVIGLCWLASLPRRRSVERP